MRVSFVLFLLASLGCPGGQRALAAEPADAEPLLERSEDLEMALRAFGFDEVRAFSWRGGILEGKISFQVEQDIKPANLSAVVLSTVKKLFRDGQAIDAKAISGVIVIAIKKPTADGSKGRPCHVSIAVRKNVERDDGKGGKLFEMQRTRAEIKGLVPDPGPEAVEAFLQSTGQASESLTPKGGKEFMLYDLKVSSKPTGTGKQGKDR